MLKSLRLILFFGLLTHHVFAVKISGNAESFYHGHKLYLYQIQECLYGSKKLIDSCTINISGSFKLQAAIENTSLLVLNSNFVNFQFIGEAQEHYHVQLQAPENEALVSIANNTYLPISFKKADLNNLNIQLSLFNLKLDSIQEIQFNNFNPSSFSRALKKEFPNSTASYLNESKYSIIAEQLLNLGPNEKDFFNAHLNQKIFRLNNEASVNLLSKFYEGAFYKLRRFHPQLDGHIQEGDIDAIINTFEKWDFISTEQQLHFALIQNLFELHFDQDYHLAKIVSLFAQLENKLQNKDSQKLYHAAQENLRFLSPKSKFPGELGNKKSDLNLVVFYNGQSQIAIREMGIAKDILEALPQKVPMITYCVDCKKESAINNERADFHIPKDPFVYEQFGLYSVPKFSLVDGEGHYIKEWLDMPSNRFEKELVALIRQSKK